MTLYILQFYYIYLFIYYIFSLYTPYEFGCYNLSHALAPKEDEVIVNLSFRAERECSRKGGVGDPLRHQSAHLEDHLQWVCVCKLPYEVA